MSKKKPVKLFYSHCHNDGLSEDFPVHDENEKVKYWSDKHIPPGTISQEVIDRNLRDSDIVLCFISDRYLDSHSCVDELKSAYEQRKIIIPIVLHLCFWEQFHFDDGLALSATEALPCDEKKHLLPVSEWYDSEKAWRVIADRLSLFIDIEYTIKNCKLKDEFANTLNDCGQFKRHHPNKDALNLNDIFVWPEFKKNYLEDSDEDAQKKDLFCDIRGLGKIWITGEDQSGKTSLAKRIFLCLREEGLIPVLFSCPYEGKFNRQLEKRISEQYAGLKIEISDLADKVIPIMDDFHQYEGQDTLISALDSYYSHILITDKIYSFNFRNKKLADMEVRYCQYRINEFYPSKRNELIEKWISVNSSIKPKNDFYKELDEYTKVVDVTLGKTISRGIIRSYPVVLLAIMSSYAMGSERLSDISSHGHYYSALIYLNFRKHGLNNQDFDEYSNFLCAIAYHIYKSSTREISTQNLTKFIEDDYKNKYNLTTKPQTLLGNLEQMGFLNRDRLGSYRFHYKYFFYYFVAQCIADSLSEKKEDIARIFKHLHNNENAYIAIFLSHHSKDDIIIENIRSCARVLFEGFQPIALNKDDSSFVSEKIVEIGEIALPGKNVSELERHKDLAEQDKVEKDFSKQSDVHGDEDETDPLAVDLRRSVKTAEVMGHIIRNRSGSLPKEKIKMIFIEGVNIHLRVLTSFFELLKYEGNKFESYLAQQIKEKKQEERRRQGEAKGYKQDLLDKQAKEDANAIISHFIFHVVVGWIGRIVFSLGSDRLSDIITEVCDQINTPVSSIVKRWVLMQYKKDLAPEEIQRETKNFGLLAKRVRDYMICHHCRFHETTYQSRQKIHNHLGIPISDTRKKQPERENLPD